VRYAEYVGVIRVTTMKLGEDLGHHVTDIIYYRALETILFIPSFQSCSSNRIDFRAAPPQCDLASEAVLFIPHLPDVSMESEA